MGKQLIPLAVGSGVGTLVDCRHSKIRRWENDAQRNVSLLHSFLDLAVCQSLIAKVLEAG